MTVRHRILVTGANGFVGAWLLRELDARRRSVELEVFAAGHAQSEGRDLDITDRAQVERLVAEVQPTAVIHLAAVAAPAEARGAPFRAWDVNLMGTLHLACAVLASAPAARFVHVGSSEVYGASFNALAEGEAITEEAALKPVSVYGATKAAADILVGQLAHDGLRSIRFRPFNHTGPGQADAYVVPSFARQIAEIEAGLRPPTIRVGDLEVRRDVLDVRDVVRAYADAALSDVPEAFGKAYNLASGSSVRIGSVLEVLAELSGLKVDIEVDPGKLRRAEVPAAAGSAAAARHAFSWQPQIPLAKTLSDVLDDWKATVA